LNVALEQKLVVPREISAVALLMASAVESYLSSLALPRSTMKTFPNAETLMSAGALSLFKVKPDVEVVKSDWPMTNEALTSPPGLRQATSALLGRGESERRARSSTAEQAKSDTPAIFSWAKKLF